MSSLDDLGRALRDDAAANAPRASMINVDAVARAARARRAPRQWAVGTLSVVAVLGFGGIAVAAVTPPTMIAATESADLEAGVTDAESAPLAEGGGIEGDEGEALERTPPVCGSAPPETYSDRVVTLFAGELPAGAVDATEFIGKATLTNSGSESLTLLVPTEVTGVFVRDGIVASEALAVDTAPRSVQLEPGASLMLPVRISTVDCGDGSTLTGEAEVVVVVDVSIAATGQIVSLVAAPVTVALD